MDGDHIDRIINLSFIARKYQETSVLYLILDSGSPDSDKS